MKLSTIIAFLLSAAIGGCKPKAEAIQYGKDQCAYCKMTIGDPKFGAEIVTEKGRVYKFDAIECLIAALPGYKDANIVLVTPFDGAGTLVSVDSVVFLKSDAIRSPMGAGLAAFLVKKPPTEFLANGQWMQWNEIQQESE